LPPRSRRLWPPDKTLIGDAIDDYLKFVKMQRKKRTYLTYRYTLDVLLRASYKKKYAEDATRQDAIDFMTHCYELGLGARTVYDKLVTVLQLFKRHGREKMLEKGDWPSFVDTIRPIYEPEEITAMFKVATEDEADMLKFILGSGLRDQEIRYVEYLDLDSNHDLVRVTAKKEWDFTPKNWEERIVPLPHVLVERLKKRKERKKARPHDLIFGNTKGNPDSEMDMVVKRVAERAGLNCGRCVTEHGNKCEEGPYCMNFFLHKFRHYLPFLTMSSDLLRCLPLFDNGAAGARRVDQSPDIVFFRYSGLQRIEEPKQLVSRFVSPWLAARW
jgi:integrase/recombinase XerD